MNSPVSLHGGWLAGDDHITETDHRLILAEAEQRAMQTGSSVADALIDILRGDDVVKARIVFLMVLEQAWEKAARGDQKAKETIQPAAHYLFSDIDREELCKLVDKCGLAKILNGIAWATTDEAIAHLLRDLAEVVAMRKQMGDVLIPLRQRVPMNDGRKDRRLLQGPLTAVISTDGRNTLP